MTVPCARCRQPIEWLHTPAGNRMPLDPYDTDADVPGNVAVVGGEAVALKSAELRKARARGDVLRVPHFATCAAKAATDAAKKLDNEGRTTVQERLPL